MDLELALKIAREIIKEPWLSMVEPSEVLEPLVDEIERLKKELEDGKD